MSVIGIDVSWDEMEELLDKIEPKEGQAKYQTELVCSYSIKEDHALQQSGFVFLGVLKKDHIINKEIHVWRKP